MAIPLEDNAGDIVGKAQRGLRISDSQLAERANVSPDAVRRAREGDADEQTLRAIAPVLALNGEALVRLQRGEWQPAEVPPIDGMAQFNTEYGDMTVNAYLVWDPASREAAAFDTGADSSELVRTAAVHDLTFRFLLLTHSHPDHIADLERLRSSTGAVVYVPENESVPGADVIAEGHQFSLGALRIDTLLTCGHSPGGLTYVVTGLARPLAMVGDSLFAASMGGGAISYEAALRNNREKILTLPDETIVCPGHGPLTTVGKEKRENAFFAK